MEQPVEPLNWQRMWLSEEIPLGFLLEITFRSLVMYLLILFALRITGKRGVKQLSLFELTILLSLGSAAGDPMFYPEVPLLHAIAVFGVVIVLYLVFNRLTEKSHRIEKLLEGEPICIIEEGRINLKSFKKQNLTYQELFGEIRQQQVEHLGQIRKLYLEATGEVSIFFYEDAQVKPGMPIFPEIVNQPMLQITQPGEYACWTCGNCQTHAPSEAPLCSVCHKNLWLKACTAKRIT